jgi:hypothetical protein
MKEMRIAPHPHLYEIKDFYNCSLSKRERGNIKSKKRR